MKKSSNQHYAIKCLSIGGAVGVIFFFAQLFYSAFFLFSSTPVVFEYLSKPFMWQCIYFSQCQEMGCIFCSLITPFLIIIECSILGLFIGLLMSLIKNKLSKKR